MGKKLWLDTRGQARVDRRVNRADDHGGRVHQANRLVATQAKHVCSLEQDEDGLCAHDREAVSRASRLLSPSLTPTG